PLPEYIDVALDDTASVGGKVAHGVQKLVAPEDFRSRIPEIKTRTLLVTGGKDTATPPAAAEWTYDNLSGEKKILIYEGIGHVPFVGAYADKFNSDVDNFLQ